AIEDDQLLKIIGENKERYWPQFKEYFKNHPEYEPGQLLLKAFTQKKEWGLGWVTRKLMLAYGFFDYTQKIDGTGRREANLWKFINLIEKTSREPGHSLLKLVEEGYQSMTLEEVGQNTDAASPVEPNKINLMTVHSSKGLQFQYIFVPYLGKKPNKTSHTNFCALEDEKIFAFRVPLGEHDQFMATPLERSYLKNMAQREDDESLRVLYVALTRAKSQLFLSWTGKSEKNSWSTYLENFLEQNDHPHLSFQKISAASGVEMNVLEEKGAVKAVWEAGRHRFAEVTNEKKKDELKVDKSDLITSQKIRWQGVVIHKLFESLKQHDLEQVKSLAKRWLPDRFESAIEALDFVSDYTDVPLMKII
ncbi:MAG: hypothetical protein MJK18_03775, partial [Bdellovibrionales bacterium]|nr:hypothetical protein [Bdellovibrionales bacterium]